jgi:hypothetical protein
MTRKLEMYAATLAVILMVSIAAVSIFTFENMVTALPLVTEKKSVIENLPTASLANPLFVESYMTISKKTVQVNGSNATLSSFSGNGTINGIPVKAAGIALAFPRSDGKISLNGSALLTSENAKASYTFQAIGYSDNGVSRSSGAAFFDGNATGNLGFLANLVGIYKTASMPGSNGTFVMWEWK